MRITNLSSKRFFVFFAGVFWLMMSSAHPFFKVNKCYLFIPRHDYVSVGKVVDVTSQEVVFDDIKTIERTKQVKGDNEKDRIKAKANIVRAYINSKDRSQYEAATPLTGIPIAYSRSEMATIEVDPQNWTGQ